MFLIRCRIFQGVSSCYVFLALDTSLQAYQSSDSAFTHKKHFSGNELAFFKRFYLGESADRFKPFSGQKSLDNPSTNLYFYEHMLII
jgi:hypothetical protein